MLPRRTYHPEDHLCIGVELTHSHGLRCGEMIFVGGQADIDGKASVTRPDDLRAQTNIAMQGMLRVLESLDASVADLVMLRAFYIPDPDVDEFALLNIIADQLGEQPGPGPAITLIPIETHCFNRLTIEIEGTAMRGHNGERLARCAAYIPDGSRLPRGFSQAIRCGQMIFTSAQTAQDIDQHLLYPGNLSQQSRVVLGKLDRLLNALGADLHDAVKTNVFNVEPGDQEEWKSAAAVRASYYKEPGPAATGLSLRALPVADMMVRCDVVAMRDTDGSRLPRLGVWPTGHWDWPIHLPYRHGVKVGDMIYIGGQVSLTPTGGVIDPGNIESQTHTAMQNIQKVLQEYHLDLEHLVKINTFYVGASGETDLQRNAAVRAGYYRDPGPVSTGIPFPYLAYKDMLIEIDCVAMV